MKKKKKTKLDLGFLVRFLKKALLFRQQQIGLEINRPYPVRSTTIFESNFDMKSIKSINN